MAYIEKRTYKSGKTAYRARIRQEGAPEISETFPTKKEATDWSRKMEAEIRAGRFFGREEVRERTFSEFIDRYISKELPKIQNTVVREKQNKMLTWWKLRLGSYYLCHITSALIAESRDILLGETTRRGKLRTGSTTNRYLSALSRAYTIAHKEWHWVKENPVQGITRPKENKGRERFLEPLEIQQLLECCKKSKSPHLYPVTLFALSTGARKGEILGLKWADVDVTRSTATFRDTKNGETRTVFLNSNILNCLVKERQKRIVFSEYVFPCSDGKKPADIRTAWEYAVEETGLSKDVVFHTLRHTVGSLLAMRGSSALEIGAILGHKTLAMIKLYSHLSTSSTAAALEGLNKEVLDEIA